MVPQAFRAEADVRGVTEVLVRSVRLLSVSVQPPAALETLDVGWFDVHDPPPLSLGRVNQRQLERALAHHRDPSLPSEFDWSTCAVHDEH